MWLCLRPAVASEYPRPRSSLDKIGRTHLARSLPVLDSLVRRDTRLTACLPIVPADRVFSALWTTMEAGGGGRYPTSSAQCAYIVHTPLSWCPSNTSGYRTASPSHVIMYKSLPYTVLPTYLSSIRPTTQKQERRKKKLPPAPPPCSPPAPGYDPRASPWLPSPDGSAGGGQQAM